MSEFRSNHPEALHCETEDEAHIGFNVAFLFIKPAYLGESEEILKAIEDAGLEIVYKAPIKFSKEDVDAIYQDSMNEHFFQAMSNFLTDHQSLAIIVGSKDSNSQEILMGLKKTESGQDGPIRKHFGREDILSNEEIDEWSKQRHIEQDKITIVLTQSNVIHVPDTAEQSANLIKRCFGNRFNWLDSRGCLPKEISELLQK